MKNLLIIFSLHVSFNCFAQKSETEFAIYFGNDFEKDSVTIFANGILIAKNIKLRQTMISPQNLIIRQDRNNITVWPHYEAKQTFKKIPHKDSILALNISMNNSWRSFSFNLKEGRFLYPEYFYFRVGWSVIKILTIRQDKQGPMML